MPEAFILGTHELGTGGHRLVALVAESFLDQYPDLTVRLLPAGVDTARSYLARLGDVQATIHVALAMYQLQEGIFDYAFVEWGPQPVNYIHLPMHVGMCFPVRGDSGVETGADLRGKTVATFPGSPAPSMINESLLAFFDLTWDDVVPVDYPSPPTAYRGVVDGDIVTSFFNLSSGLAYEGAALPAGWKYLEMPASDTAGWARVKAVAPMEAPRLSPVGGGIDPAKPLAAMTMAYPSYMCWDFLDPDISYWIARAIRECYPLYAPKYASLKNDWTPEKHWTLWDADACPMAEGAVRYYKEIGEWTAEREAMNKERLEHQAELRAHWDKVVRMAASA